jgi:LPXTG-site transpeptidase (sortase) family protein
MPERRDARSMRRVTGLRLAALGSVLAATGIVVWLYGADIAYFVGLVPTTNPYQSTFVATSIPVPESLFDSVATTDSVNASTTVSPARPVSLPTKPPRGRRLVIPRINANVVVARGDPEQALTRGAYHEPGTADPGHGGNVVLAGHRNLRVFSLLYQLRRGDPIVLYWMGKEYDYRVSKVFDVGPKDIRILQQTGDERLTLYTCTPREFGDKRTVVVALRVKP